MIVVVWLLSIAPLAVHAKPIEQRIDAQREAIASTQAEREAAQKALAVGQERLAFLEQKTRELDTERAALEKKRQALDEREMQLQAGLAKHRDDLMRRLRAAYPLTRGSILQAVLGDGNALQANRDLRYLQALIHPVQDTLRSLEAQQIELTENRAAIVVTERSLQQAGERLDAHNQTIREALDEQQRLLAHLGQTLDEQQQALKSMLERKRRLDREVAAARREAAKKTPLPDKPTSDKPVTTSGIPIAGQIQRGFGESLPPGQLRTEGVEFRAPAGSPVRAIAAGTVAFSGPLKGWGQLVMLRHHDNHLSLYAHCRSLDVSKGEQVVRGQTMCSSGVIDADREGLYVEVRRGNRPINPSRWPAWRTALND